jgi:hypothetical protein
MAKATRSARAGGFQANGLQIGLSDRPGLGLISVPVPWFLSMTPDDLFLITKKPRS